MRVAVLGAGYAGLTLARRLEDRLPADVGIVVVNDGPDHLVRHELHRAIRRPEVLDAIAVPLAEALDRASVRVARVTDVDPAARTVSLADARTVVADGVSSGPEPEAGPASDAADAGDDTLTYDYAAVCLGSETAFHDLPGVEEYATPLSGVPDAERIRADFLDCCERGGRVVVGGAGLTGIQVAGELHALAREEGARGDVEIVLTEMESTVAPGFPEPFRRAVSEELRARDVTIRTDTVVEGADAERIDLADGSLPYDQFVWAGGIRGPDATGGARLNVRGDLRMSRETFAVGDAAKVVDADGEPVPASASAAVREAKTVAHNLARLVEHDRSADPGAFDPRLDPYRFDVPGWIVSVGDGAVAQVGPTVVTGAAARAMKASVDAGHLGGVGAIRRAVRLVEAELDG